MQRPKDTANTSKMAQEAAKIELIKGTYGPYIKISKGSRWLNIAKQTWQKILELKGDIMEMTKSEYDGTLKLNTYDEITVNEYKDKRYICLRFIRTKDAKTYNNRMNFTIPEWEHLMIEGQRRSCPEKTKDNKQKAWPKKMTIYQEESDLYYFSKQDVPADRFVTKKRVENHTPKQWVAKIGRFVLGEKLMSRRTVNCYGCLNDRPSMTEHPCIMDDWSSDAALYHDELMGLWTLNEFQDQVDSVARYMKWSQFDKDIVADVYQSGELRELMMNSEEDLSQRMIFSKILTDQTTSNDETEIHIPNAMVVGMRHYGNEQLPIGETYQL